MNPILMHGAFVLCFLSIGYNAAKYDCIDIHKQHAFAHPKLQNHILQSKPTSIPKGLRSSSGLGTKRSAYLKELKGGGCRDGTVPMERRTQTYSLRGSNSLSKNNNYYVNYTTKGFGPFHGAAGSIAVYNPLLYMSDQSSESAITLTIGSPGSPNKISFGWTADNFTKTGCYNTLCPGFVQMVGSSLLGSAIEPVSTVNGPTYAYYVSVFLDSRGNWWLHVDSAVVGYWPKNIFTGNTFSASSVTWGGGTSNPHGYDQFAGMVSGQYPYEGYGQSGFFDDLQLIKAKSPKFVDVLSDEIDSFEEIFIGCYRVDRRNSTGLQSPSSFFFGGPGGYCITDRYNP